MLPLRLPISDSNNLVLIHNFDILYELARCSKCQMFVVLAATNKMYGFIDDCCSIHEIDVPFKLTYDLIFRFDNIDKEEFFQNSGYFIAKEWDWVILPDYYYPAYVAGDLYAEHDPYYDQYLVRDKGTKQLITGQIKTTRAREVNDTMRHNLMNQLEGYFTRLTMLQEPHYFSGLENNPAIKSIWGGKTAQGRDLVHLQDENVNVAFYMYKSLFSLNMNDSLDAIIAFDKYQTNTFMATFIPKKKKNPIILKELKNSFFYSERIHCMFINIAM